MFTIDLSQPIKCSFFKVPLFVLLAFQVSIKIGLIETWASALSLPLCSGILCVFYFSEQQFSNM